MKKLIIRSLKVIKLLVYLPFMLIGLIGLVISNRKHKRPFSWSIFEIIDYLEQLEHLFDIVITLWFHIFTLCVFLRDKE